MARFGSSFSCLALCLLFSTSIFAEEGFYLESDLKGADRPNALEARLKAVVHILTRAEKRENGSDIVYHSGVIISNSGYILTTLHSFSMTKEILQGTQFHIKDGEDTGWWDHLEQVPKNLCLSDTCVVFPDFKVRSKNPAVKVIGSAAQLAYNAKISLYTKIDALTPDRDFQKKNEKDFVILKVDPGKNVLPCIPVSKQDHHIGDHVWTLGFPNPNAPAREKGRMVEFKRKYVTHGDVIIAPTDLVDSDFQTNADGWIGMSGGPVINKEGELIGITSKIGPIPSSKERAVIGVQIEAIKAEVEKAQEKGVFDCKVGGE